MNSGGGGGYSNLKIMKIVIRNPEFNKYAQENVIRP